MERSESGFRFVAEYPVRWGDIDSVGVLNNAVYLTLLEQARHDYFRQLELLEEGQFPFVLGDARIRFQAPGKVGPVRISARVTRLGGKSFDMEYEVVQDDRRLARASATLVYVDRDLASREIPELARRRISEFEGIAVRAAVTPPAKL